jgi:hypothetical protein
VPSGPYAGDWCTSLWCSYIMSNAQALEIGRLDPLELFPRTDTPWTRSLVVLPPTARSTFPSAHLIPLYSKHYRPH